jgi:UDP-N-acetylmuramoylalanine--D-glutamate ligase
MGISYFKDKKVTVLGLGLHGGGVGIVKFLVNNGARVVVTDLKNKESLETSLLKLKGLKNVEYVLGQHRQEDFSKSDLIIKNPYVAWDSPHIKLALENNIPVEMDSSLFFRFCKNPIIGVTGTKGKTTVASLIYEILKSAGKNPIKVGIGQVSVLDKLDVLEKDSVVVFELSSWRLSALKKEKKSPQIAVVTNILRDHLNYYKTMKDYIADKENIFLFQNPNDWLVANDDDERVKEFYSKAKSQILKFSLAPSKDGNYIFLENKAIYLNNGVDVKKVMDIEEIKLPGRHNIYNVMAAIGATHAFGIEVSEIKKAVANFSGISHRLEFVKNFKEVKYYNDTTATIPDAAISSLNCFQEPVVLIAGGEDKGLDFSAFGKEIVEKVKKLVLFKGSATEKLLAEIKKNDTGGKFSEVPIVDSMEKALEAASQMAQSGDIVLLSPGATSFGLFLNEFDRGDKFKIAVEKLK